MRTFANLKRKRIGSDFNLLDYSFGRRFPKPKNPGPFLRLGFFCCVCCIGNGLVRAFTGVRAVFQKGHARIFNLDSVQKSLTNPNGRSKIKGTSINAVKQDTFYGRLHRRELPGGARQHV